tara:strand:+ start:127 stop:762 length:636 start_codon:yes stop_codon:yes gene_type:complete
MIDATNLFNNWVDLGKDNGMVLNHGPSVEFMLNLIPQDILMKYFSFVDIGCGNGWVVKKIREYEKCQFSLGIDGAKKMIKKAKLNDSQSKYIQLDINNLESYQPNIDFSVASFDVVFSMEVLYYLKSPEITLQYICSKLLKEGGCCIVGIDHYLENKPSLSWEEHLNVPLCTYSINEWKEMFNSAGFSTVKQYQFGQEKDWSGTLIFYAEK